MRHLKVVLLALVALCMAAPLAAQRGVSGVVSDKVRAELAAKWNDTSAVQTEHGFCAVYRVIELKDERVYYVFGEVDALEDSGATGYSVRMICPDMPGVARGHTHPPTSCADDAGKDCKVGGVDAYQCAPSPTDRRNLRLSAQPFGVIQCDRKALVFYFPSDTVLHGTTTRPARTHAPAVFYLGSAITLGAIALHPIDRDLGGYTPAWTDHATYPKEFIHASMGWMVAGIGMDLNARPFTSAAFTCAVLAPGFELTQGFVNSHDIVAGCAGAFLHAGWRKWRGAK